MLTAAWLLALAPLGAPLTVDDDDPTAERFPTLADVRPRLAELMRAGIETRAPNASFARGMQRASVFDGSYDWHSCVIAHWALLVHARATGDDGLRDWVVARLGPAALEAELETLAWREPRAALTWPYDEAWFGMLLSELVRAGEHGGVDRAALLALRLRVEKRLLAALEEQPFPENLLRAEDGAPTYCGFYRSWLFAWLLVRWSDPVTPGAADRLAAWRVARVEPERAAITALREAHGFDFLWVPALLALVDHTCGADVAAFDPGELPPLPASVRIATVHVLGLELSRVWPLAIEGASDARARAVYEGRVRELLARPELWEQDFAACSHWVPQYLFIGEWLADGRR
jgi:hypothetical protein